MKKPILFLLIASSLSFGAVTTNTVWEVGTTGASGNGGCFDPTAASPGTDWSQQASSQKTYTDLVIDSSDNTKATSAGNAFGATDVGNCYNMTGGTGFTVKRVVLVSQAAGVGTFNESLGTTGSTGGQATMGGALDNLTRPAAVAGNTVYVKATATYTITATQTFSAGGTAGNPITYIGYTNTRGDNGQVTVQRTANNSVSIFAITGVYRRFFNFIADSTGGTAIKGFIVTAAHVYLNNCKAMNTNSSGIELGSASYYSRIVNCWATGISAGGGAFFVQAIGSAGAGAVFIGCVASDNAIAGFASSAASVVGPAITMDRCISVGNTDGFRLNATAPVVLFNAVAYGNSANGLQVVGSNSGDGLVVMNSVFVNNGAWGIRSDTNYAASGKYQLPLDFNAFYNNTSGARSNVPAGDNDVTLTGDPFTNGAGSVFTLNNTPGAGAALRGTGFPGVLQAGGTGFSDVGPLQHQDTGGGGGGGQKGYTFVARQKAANPDLWALVHPQSEAAIYWPFPMWLSVGILALVAVVMALRARR